MENTNPVDELFQEFLENDLMEDRSEYDVDEYLSSYPHLTREQATDLYNRVQSYFQSEE